MKSPRCVNGCSHNVNFFEGGLVPRQVALKKRHLFGGQLNMPIHRSALCVSISFCYSLIHKN